MDLADKAFLEDREELGPLDESEVAGVKLYVDLGGIKVPPREGLFLHLELEENTKQVVAVGMDYAGSSLQVQAFAAPKNSGLWHEVRNQLSVQLRGQGARVEEVSGSLGIELKADIPVLLEGAQVPETRHTRIVGVDGPRWFLRGIIVGQALVDDAAAAEVEDLFRSLVVVRGQAPMPPKDMIPLRVPPEGSSDLVSSVAPAGQV